MTLIDILRADKEKREGNNNLVLEIITKEDNHEGLSQAVKEGAEKA